MPGYFSSPFGDDETTGFFGGYRQPTMRPLSGATSNATVVPVSDSTPAPPTATPNILSYVDGRPVINPQTGQPYPLPPELNMQKNLAIAQTIREASENSDPNIGQANASLMFAPLFVAGARMDYKRPHGTFGPYESQFRPVSYYNYGVMAAKAGYGQEEALRNAGLYNRIFGGATRNRYGLDGDDAEKFIEQGYNDYANGRWTQKPAD